MRLILPIILITAFILTGGFFLYRGQARTLTPPASLKLYSLAPDQTTLTPPKTAFKAAEPVTFVLIFDKKPTSFWQFVKVARAQSTTGNITTRLLYNNEEAKDITVAMKPLEKNQVSFSLLNKNPNQFRPGKYQFKVTREEEGQIQELAQDFVWGVLAINTNKSIFTPGENVYLQMASLSESGRTLCNSDLKLEITDPAGKVQTPEIKHSQTCGNDNVTDNPDYFTYYLLSQPGTYHIKLANNSNKYSIEDQFEVKESVPFVVERVGATRINPFKSAYTMNIKITANEDFEGEVIETVPADFKIENSEDGKQNLVWNVKLNKGETFPLSYTYQAPKISPELFLLGPLSLRPTIPGVHPATWEEGLVFKESRQWQIASDAVATAFMETPDATQSTQFWSSVSGSVTYDTSQKKSGLASWKLDTTAANTAAFANSANGGIGVDGRASFYIRFTNLPAASTAIMSTKESGTVFQFQVLISSAGVLSLWTGDGASQIGSNGSTLATGQWYRLALAWKITDTTHYDVRLFLDGNSTPDITGTNTPTLASAAPSQLSFGWWGASPGVSKVLNIQHVYADNSNSLTDTGDIRVTAKLPTTGIHVDFNTLVIGGAVNQRPIDETNRWEHRATTQVHQDYDIQAWSAGDVDISGNIIVALTSWIWAADGAGANGTPKMIYFNGSSGDQESAVSLTATATLFTKIVDTAKYPDSGVAAVGMESTGAGADTFLYEAGVLVAYKVEPPRMQFSGIKLQGIKVN